MAEQKRGLVHVELIPITGCPTKYQQILTTRVPEPGYVITVEKEALAHFCFQNLQRVEKLGAQLVSIYGEALNSAAAAIFGLFHLSLNYAGCRCLPPKLCK